MSDIETLFLAAYPLWPKQLLEKFSSLLSFEVAKFNPEINLQIVAQYNDLRARYAFSVNPNIENAHNLLLPKDSEVSRVDYRYDIIVYSAQKESGDYLGSSARSEYYAGRIFFDRRIFSSISTAFDLQYSVSGQYLDYDISYVPGKWPMPGGIVATPFVVKSLSITPVVYVNTEIREYNGARTVLAMLENGVAVDINQRLLSEFVTFLSAYNKYSGELAAENSFQAEKNRQTMTDYRNSISEKLTSRKNELNDLRTQMSFAAKNETASAKRDMQGLALSAQSLMLQLQDKLK
jgi:hypothetical protein